MSARKPDISDRPVDPENDVQLHGVFVLWKRGLIPVSEQRLRQLINAGTWECGKLAGRYVCTGRQHYRNVLRFTGREDEVTAA